MSEENNTEKLDSITIWDIYRDKNHYILTAEIKENGDLFLEGQDLGPDVLEWFGDSDYEYFYTIKQEWKDTVLLHLLAEKFTLSDTPQMWLKRKNIPYDFSNWI